MAKNLVIVESPAKAKTIEKFLGEEYVVLSSLGHIRDLPVKELGVDVKKGFLPAYEIPKEKTKLLQELKKGTEKAEVVWLATDEDREGEAIAWHLAEALKLDVKKTKRIVFHEITKKAIEEAINNPRSIDKNLVDAQQARRVLDRLVGFELSPILWKKVKPALSAGRVQSVAVRLIVEREEEIKNFKSLSTYKVVANFDIQREGEKLSIPAELNCRFNTKEDAVAFLEKCKEALYKVTLVETKPATKSPAAPFTTSTLQQEASRKLGFSVARTMMVAQQLYETGKITYMRTDSVNLSDLALNMAKDEVTQLYGKQYVKTRKFATKSKGAQEAHEAIRPTELNKQTIEGDASQKKLYDLIWKRTIASQMSEAQFEKTTVTIDISTTKEKFVAKGEVLKFDGFLKVYLESSDEESEEAAEGMLPSAEVGETLLLKDAKAEERFSQHPPRYTEASLVRKLEELGIGRPSTYAPTISTILKREYVVKENRDGYIRNYNLISLKAGKIKEEVKEENTDFEKSKLFPTDVGGLVTNFLVQYFGNILDYNFTAEVEKEFDEVAQGLKVWNEMIKEFYTPFHKQVESTLKNSERASGVKLLGKDPKTSKNVYVKLGRYGLLAQIGEAEDEEKPKFASMKKGQSLDTITLEEALALFDFPKNLGEYEGGEMTVAFGRFGPYVKHKELFYSIDKADDPVAVTKERAMEIIEEKRKKQREKTIKEFPENPAVKVLNGKWGPYITADKKNYKVPKEIDPATLTLEQCLKIIEDAPSTKPVKKAKK